MVFIRSNLEIDMLILEKCTNRALRLCEIIKLIRSSPYHILDRIVTLNKKDLLEINVQSHQYRSGSGKMLLTKDPKKYQRKIYKTTPSGLRLVSMWKQIKEVYEYG